MLASFLLVKVLAFAGEESSPLRLGAHKAEHGMALSVSCEIGDRFFYFVGQLLKILCHIITKF